MLVDKIRVDFHAGKGGDGGVSFAKYGRSLGKNGRLYYPKKGKPDGGDGGNGGNIYLEGSRDLYDLTSLTQVKDFRAEDGAKGDQNTKNGKDGEDLIIKVPLVSVLTNIKGEPILTIKEHGERVLFMKGGRGGEGNFQFRQGQEKTLFKYTPGKPGKSLKGFIELRLAADVVFIGFPNAGKSSMLNRLTNANVKVASYPFTTIQPQLGIMSGRVKLMDLPGLIEGVSEGKGLGKSFNKHTVYARLMAHFISLESLDIEKDYLSIRKELEEFSAGLTKKSEVIVLTKSDLFDEEHIDKRVKILEKHNKDIIVTSSFKNDLVEKLKVLFEKKIHMDELSEG